MTSKQGRKCMANKSIDRRVALRLNSWQSGALGKLWGSAWPESDTKRHWIRAIWPAEPLTPAWAQAQCTFEQQRIPFSYFFIKQMSGKFVLNQRETGIDWTFTITLISLVRRILSKYIVMGYFCYLLPFVFTGNISVLTHSTRMVTEVNIIEIETVCFTTHAVFETFYDLIG